MITLRFFASIREAVQHESLELEPPVNAGMTVAAIIEHLKHDHPRIHHTLSAQNPLLAVNQTMADLSSSIADGDELAFFPPMTGG